MIMNVDAREARFAADLESTRLENITGRIGEIVTAVCKVKLRYIALTAAGAATVIGGFNLGKSWGEHNNPPQTQRMPEATVTTLPDACIPTSLPEDPSDLFIEIEQCHQIQQNHGDDLVPLLDPSQPQS